MTTFATTIRCDTHRVCIMLCATTSLSLAATVSVADEPCILGWDNKIGQPGTVGHITAFAIYNGDLVVGGGFVNIGGVSANYIAKWDGSTWNPLGSGMSGGTVRALVVHDGSIIAGGTFTSAGDTDANFIARWDGSSWHPMGEGLNGWVHALAVYGGDLIAGGEFTTASGVQVNRIARWDGSSWHALAGGMNNRVYALTLYEGDLIAGGTFWMAGGVSANRIARWDGSSWHPLGDGVSSLEVRSLTLYNGDLIAGGTFNTAGEVWANSIARWDGASWRALGSGVAAGGLPSVRAIAVFNGDLIAGGWINLAGGMLVNKIARWDGASWYALGSGISGVGSPIVHALIEHQGSLIVGGDFNTAGGLAAQSLAGWKGIGDPPVVRSHPLNEMVALNAAATFDVSAVGSLTLAYQWRKNGFPLHDTDHIAGSTTDLLMLKPVRVSDTGVYDVVVSNPCGEIVSQPATLAVIFVPEPAEQSVFVGNAAAFSVDLVESNAVMYQWRQNGAPLVNGPAIVGAQSATLVLLSSQIAHVGSYDVVVSGDFGTAVSEAATFTVCKVGDLNCDGSIGVADLLILLAAWGECDECPPAPGPCTADLAGDCAVGVADLLVLLANWG